MLARGKQESRPASCQRAGLRAGGSRVHRPWSCLSGIEEKILAAERLGFADGVRCSARRIPCSSPRGRTSSGGGCTRGSGHLRHRAEYSTTRMSAGCSAVLQFLRLPGPKGAMSMPGRRSSQDPGAAGPGRERDSHPGGVNPSLKIEYFEELFAPSRPASAVHIHGLVAGGIIYLARSPTWARGNVWHACQRPG